MVLIKIEKKAIPTDQNKWIAGIRLSNKTRFAPVSRGNNILLFDTKEEAEEYLNDNY